MSASWIIALLIGTQAPPAPAATPEPPPYQPGRANQHASADLMSLFSDDDYPVAAMRAEEQGTVGFHVDIAADGSVTRCRITSTSGSARLDQATCDILSVRAHYLPATDRRGRPTAGSDDSRVHWVLPPPPPRANLTSYFSDDDYPAEALRNDEQGVVAFSLTISLEGRVSRCTITGSSGSASLDETTCRILTERARYAPARDAAGHPTEGADHGRIAWRLPEDGEEEAQPPAEPGAPPVRARPLQPLDSYFTVNDYPLAAEQFYAEGYVEFSYDVGIDGRVHGCRVTRSPFITLFGEVTCDIMRRRARFEPAHDAAGHPVPDTLHGRIFWGLTDGSRTNTPNRRRLRRQSHPTG